MCDFSTDSIFMIIDDPERIQSAAVVEEISIEGSARTTSILQQTGQTRLEPSTSHLGQPS